MESIPSQALLAAQERLLALRQQLPVTTTRPQPPIIPQPVHTLTVWPSHLGWHSESLSQLLAPTQKAKPAGDKNPREFNPTSIPSPLSPLPSPLSTLSLSPDLALALLHHNRVAESRIWFLLRHLDETGRGWVELPEIRRYLSEKTSMWCICGWRQLRILLGQGDGLFWQRQGERLWLRSVVKVAAALGLTRLSGHPVALPVHLLTRPIGEVKAHFYASFHSGRNHDHQPIARATLSHLSGLSPQTQRSYEKRARVRPQTNFALGEVATPENKEHRTWQQGTAVFTFTDYQGKQGPAQYDLHGLATPQRLHRSP
ncbi:MAG: hypothetical protein IPL78_24060 [Chloroflexi bacterium]|nr:hypothetical protein [Chloroflexota bacterium]